MQDNPIWLGPKTAKISFVMTEAEKAQIVETAKSLKYTMTEYLLSLHHEKVNGWKKIRIPKTVE